MLAGPHSVLDLVVAAVVVAVAEEVVEGFFADISFFTARYVPPALCP